MELKEFLQDMCDNKRINDIYNELYFLHGDESLEEFLEEDYYESVKYGDYVVCNQLLYNKYDLIGIYYKDKLVYCNLEIYVECGENTTFFYVYKDNKIYLTEYIDYNQTLIIINEDKIEEIEMKYL